MRKTHKIHFQNPIFHKGLNVTIRHKDKWMKVNAGDVLALTETETEQEYGSGIVIGKALLPVDLVPENWLLLNHDPLGRNRDSLRINLIDIYPDFPKKSELVTVLLFIVI
jgi:hypothetical protein